MSLKHRQSALAIAASTLLALTLTACGGSGGSSADSDSKDTVSVADNSGKVDVPKNPQKYAVTDNLSFRTLQDWDKKPVAAPRALMPESFRWTKDDSIVDTGSHREPDLEALVGAEPQLVINGYRYASQQDKIKELLPDTPIVTFDKKDDESHADNLKRHTNELGTIFDEQDGAKKKTADFDKAIDQAKSAYDGKSSVMGLITSGGDINYSDPKEGRGASPLFESLGLKHALDVKGSDDNHEGNDVSVETIAKSNPDWMIVLDRDASFAEKEKDYAPAKDLIMKSKALKNTTAVKKNQIIVLPSELYLDEGIEMYTDIFKQTADAFKK